MVRYFDSAQRHIVYRDSPFNFDSYNDNYCLIRGDYIDEICARLSRLSPAANETGNGRREGT